MQRLTVPADLAQLERVRNFVAHALDSFGASVALSGKTVLIAEEIFTNVANHAYGPGGGETAIYCRQTGNGVCLEFWDSGAPFDPGTAPQPDTALPAELREIGGLGILLVRQLATSLEYRREGGKNHLSIHIEE